MIFIQHNKKTKAKIIYNTSMPVIFSAKYFADALWKVANQRNIEVNLKTYLVEVKPNENIAIFQNVDDPNKKTEIEVNLEIILNFAFY